MIEITIVLSFVFVTILLLVTGFYYSRPQTLIKQRVERVFEETNQTRDEELQAPFFQRVLAPIGGAVSRLLQNYLPVRVMQRTQERLLMANLETRLTPSQFQGFCWISGVMALGVMFFFLLSTGIARGEDGTVLASKAILYLMAGTAGGYILPQFFLSRFIKKRQEAILLTQPYALDLLSITVEAGLGFDASLAYAMRKLTGPLTVEFAKSLNEIRLGKPRLEAFEDLGKRTGVEDLKIFLQDGDDAVVFFRLDGEVADVDVAFLGEGGAGFGDLYAVIDVDDELLKADGEEQADGDKKDVVEKVFPVFDWFRGCLRVEHEMLLF